MGNECSLNSLYTRVSFRAPTLSNDGSEFSSSYWYRNKKTIHKINKEDSPDELIACVGGGSNAIGFFFEFLDEESVNLIRVEAGGKSLKEGEHAARFEGGKLGILQGV